MKLLLNRILQQWSTCIYQKNLLNLSSKTAGKLCAILRSVLCDILVDLGTLLLTSWMACLNNLVPEFG